MSDRTHSHLYVLAFMSPCTWLDEGLVDMEAAACFGVFEAAHVAALRDAVDELRRRGGLRFHDLGEVITSDSLPVRMSRRVLVVLKDGRIGLGVVPIGQILIPLEALEAVLDESSAAMSELRKRWPGSVVVPMPLEDLETLLKGAA